MKITPDRIAQGLKWRASELYERLPRSARVWIENRAANARIRRGQTAYDRSRLMQTYRQALGVLVAKNPRAPIGDYLEFGVYHGTSLSCMHAVREQLGLSRNMRLFGFDSFEGLPESAAWEDDAAWAPGQFESSMEFTRANLRGWGVPDGDVTLIAGWYENSLTAETRARHHIEHASVVMVDCDLYSSTQTVLQFTGPLVRRRAVFVFDDWDSSEMSDKQMGEARAFTEYLAAHPEFTAEEIPGLDYKNKPSPRVFLVTRI